MQVRLDDNLLMGIFTDVSEALEAGRLQAEGQGRIIVDVIVDGQVLTHEELDRLCDPQTHKSIQDVQLHSQDPLDLTRETLEQADEALRQAVKMQAEVGELLQAGAMTEAMTKLTKPLDLWGKVYQAVVQCGLLLQIDFATISVDGESADAVLNSLASQLRSIRDALTDQDEVLLADEISYEMADTATRWEGLIRVMGERVASSAQQG